MLEQAEQPDNAGQPETDVGTRIGPAGPAVDPMIEAAASTGRDAEEQQEQQTPT